MNARPGREDLSRLAEGGELARALPEEPGGQRDVLGRHLDGQRLLRARGRDRDAARSTTSPAQSSPPTPARRWPGAWRAAGRARSAAREINSYTVWLGTFCAGLPDRPRRLAAAVLAAHARPAGAALVLRVALVLQPRPHLRRDAARLPGPRVAARPLHLRRQDRPRPARLAGLAGVGARRRDRLSRRLSHRPGDPERRERDRRRALGGDRRRPDRERRRPVRQLPDRGEPSGLRPGRLERRGPRPHPDERPLRGCGRAGRHLRPGLLRGLPAGVSGCSAGAASGRTRPDGRIRDDDHLGHALHHRALARRAALRGGATGGHARLRVGRLALHAVLRQLEHERHDPAGAADLRLLLPHVAMVTRRLRDARRAGQVRAARRCFRSGPATRTPTTTAPASGSRSGRCSPERCRSSCSSSTVTRSTTRRCSSTTRSATSSAAPRRSRSGTGASTTRGGCRTCRSCSTCSRRRSWSGRSSSTAGPGTARRCRWPPSAARCSSASSWC